MRSTCTWSMSTVGLTAQEISFPIENPFLRGSYCHSMAGSKPSWSYRHEPTDNFYFTMNTPDIDHGYRTQQKLTPPSYEKDKHSPSSQRLPRKISRPTQHFQPCSTETPTLSPADDDQVVPSFQRLSVCDYSSPPQTPDRCSKPLPPIPPQTDISLEQAMDSEVGSFLSTDENIHLVPSVEQCSKSSFRNGLATRRSFGDCGQINLAYHDDPSRPQSQQQLQHHSLLYPTQEVREHYEHQRKEPPVPVVCQKSQDKAQRRLRRSHSGPAGSLNKPSQLRSTSHRCPTSGMDKPEVPPPVPPRLLKSEECRRWSAEVSSGAYSDEDKPPKVPPRGPLSSGSSRTPSPKSLPSYINGVMPPTQSFAPDPKYVSGRGLHRQNSEGSPRILPVMENGKKASNTHYYLLPQRAAFADSPCDCHAKRNVDLV